MMKIRRIVKEDIHDIYAFLKEAGLFVRSVQRELYEFELLIRYNPDTCFILENNKKIIGNVFGAFNGRRAWIYHLCIHPKYQSKGYGKMLVTRVEEALKKKGATKILLGLFLNNLKIVPFYEKLGYQPMSDALTFEKDIWKEESL